MLDCRGINVSDLHMQRVAEDLLFLSKARCHRHACVYGTGAVVSL